MRGIKNLCLSIHHYQEDIFNDSWFEAKAFFSFGNLTSPMRFLLLFYSMWGTLDCVLRLKQCTQCQDTITPLTSKTPRNPSNDGSFLSLIFFAVFGLTSDGAGGDTGDLGKSWSNVKCSNCSIQQNKCETLGNLSIWHSRPQWSSSSKESET